MSPTTQHQDLAAGRWNQLSLCEQLGNIGSEVGRAINAKKRGDDQRMNTAIDRALELFYFTIDDPKNKSRLREL